MPEYTAILRDIPQEKFFEILSASARKAREVYFHRHSIKAPKASGLRKPGAKNEMRAAELFALLKDTDDDEMAEEVLRTWLLTKREMLAAALDYLKIPHEMGLTESEEVSKFEKLSSRDVKKIADALKDHGSADDIRVYLKFMGSTNADSLK